jgi:hypothetical protein
MKLHQVHKITCMNDSGHSSNFTRLKEQLHIPVTQGRQGKGQEYSTENRRDLLASQLECRVEL